MVLFIVVASAIILLAAYFTYGKFLANTVFKLDDKNPVPSVEMEDGVDYVPAKKGMLLGQHFSAIAAAGPINGPILAAVIYGWAPAKLHLAIILHLILQLKYKSCANPASFYFRHTPMGMLFY